MKKNLSPEDITVLKKARNRGLFPDIVFWLFILAFVVAYTVWRIQEDEFRGVDLLLYGMYIPFLVFLFNGLFIYGREIKQGEKIVLYAICKVITKQRENKSYNYLAIGGYGDVDLSGYNKKHYSSVFTERPERFEIHLAPKTQIILFAKKIPPVVYPPAQPVKAKRR
ncbi:hypothetical protein [Haliscomenobacter hydrossis]|uniref:Uncharacterized protein n=1 Tax=Haliscomenobacter hydrossis (strain ATCC 27775 / DSM 1100 / LMG 10767 / O) TaxID=760192 RepID=F4KTM5_HALH1|nr:hypothetical protein [Haliscomenobacter hydrossis]AEE53399.1 hypothetical protein Halhy_5575 [Haliscomenobacter hydrossis DSM 1100]